MHNARSMLKRFSRHIVGLVILLLALAGPAWADFNKGMAAYTQGDYPTALKEFKMLGTERGDDEAQYLLGQMYLNGLGVTQDEAEAARWYRKSAELGHPEAQLALGNLLL